MGDVVAIDLRHRFLRSCGGYLEREFAKVLMHNGWRAMMNERVAFVMGATSPVLLCFEFGESWGPWGMRCWAGAEATIGWTDPPHRVDRAERCLRIVGGRRSIVGGRQLRLDR
jgi:hypothetical protein